MSNSFFHCLRVVKLPTGSNFQNVWPLWFSLPEGVWSCGLPWVRSCGSFYYLLTFRLRVSLKPKWLYFGQFVSLVSFSSCLTSTQNVIGEECPSYVRSGNRLRSPVVRAIYVKSHNFLQEGASSCSVVLPFSKIIIRQIKDMSLLACFALPILELTGGYVIQYMFIYRK